MHDRGEKIVNLAREILQTDGYSVLPKPQVSTISFKVLCLATILTGIGSSVVTSWVIEKQRPLNHYEKTELDALLFYTAKQKGLNEDDLRRDMLAKLRLPGFEMMTERDFHLARTYLQNKAN